MEGIEEGCHTVVLQAISRARCSKTKRRIVTNDSFERMLCDTDGFVGNLHTIHRLLEEHKLLLIVGSPFSM